MQKARYGKDSNEIVTLNEFLARQGYNRKKWTVVPCCPHSICGAPVYPYDIGANNGFKAAGQALLDRQRSQSGFNHKPRSAHSECPDSHADDIRFYGLTNYETDPETLKRIKEVLFEKSMRSANNTALKTLLEKMYGRKLTEEDRLAAGAVAKDLMKKAYFIEYPWALPFEVALRMGQATPLGKKYLVTYRHNGRQELVYMDHRIRKDTQGKQPVAIQRIEIVPREIQLCFVNRSWRKTTYKPMSNQVNGRAVGNYEVSEDAWRKLAGLGPKVSPTPPSAPITVTVILDPTKSSTSVSIDMAAASDATVVRSVNGSTYTQVMPIQRDLDLVCEDIVGSQGAVQSLSKATPFVTSRAAEKTGNPQASVPIKERRGVRGIKDPFTKPLF